MVEKGEKAPEFKLPDKDENEIDLKDYDGKWLVLYFYPKDNTPGCTTEAKDFTSAKGDFDALGAEVIGVSPDSTKSHCKFAEKHDLDITLLSDTEKEVLKKYDAWGKKKMYGREFEGVIRSTYLIDPEGKIAHAWPKVRVKGHVDDVLKKLKESKSE